MANWALIIWNFTVFHNNYLWFTNIVHYVCKYYIFKLSILLGELCFIVTVLLCHFHVYYLKCVNKKEGKQLFFIDYTQESTSWKVLLITTNKTRCGNAP
jgi:hypothetical protein